MLWIIGAVPRGPSALGSCLDETRSEHLPSILVVRHHLGLILCEVSFLLIVCILSTLPSIRSL